MDRAEEFLSAVEAVEAGVASLDQAREVLALARLCGRADLAARASDIIDDSGAADSRARTPANRAAKVGA